MIQLTAEIKIFSENNGVITGLSSNISGNNVSCGIPINTSGNNVSYNIFELVGKHDSVGGNPFIYGVSKFGDGSVYTADKVDYFIGREISDDLGEFKTPYTITLSGNDIKSVTFVFDTVNGGYPTRMSVDGTYFTDDDTTFTISDTTIVDFWNDNLTDHTIVIDRWSKPNRPFILQGVYATPTYLKIDRRSLISVDSNIIDRSDISLPSWGLISNGGNISFNDIDGEVLDYAERGLLQEGQEVDIYLEDTLSKLKTKVGNFITSKWNYDNDNRSVSVSLTDGLENLQNINFEEQPPYNEEKKFAYLLNEIFDKIKGLGYKYINIGGFPSQTYKLVKIESGSVWGEIDKICQSLGLCACVSPKDRKTLIIYSE